MLGLTGLGILSRSSQFFRTIFFYYNDLGFIMPTAFVRAWDNKIVGKILKYDEDPQCDLCSDEIPDGEQYGCEYCGNDICEECMQSDGGGYDHPGYRGEIDSGHPIEQHPGFTGGAYCPVCASEMMNDGSMEETDDGEYAETEVLDEQRPFRHDDDRELAQRIKRSGGAGASDDMIREASTRTLERDPQGATEMHRHMEGTMNEMNRRLGRPPVLTRPPLKREYGFPKDFTDKNASADAFTSAWGVVKHGRI